MQYVIALKGKKSTPNFILKKLPYVRNEQANSGVVRVRTTLHSIFQSVLSVGSRTPELQLDSLARNA